jgi:hypothetical protein
MNAFRFFFVLVFLGCTVFAEETYEVRMARPVKAGARFKISARVAFQSETNSKFGNLPLDEEKVNIACKLNGELTIIAVTGKGIAKELRFKLDEAESFSDGERAELFKAGDVITIKHGSDEDDIQINGEEAGEEQSELIDALLNVADEEEATDDDVFGAKGKVKIGEEWMANREALATEMKRQKLDGLKADDFKATARLAETVVVDGQPGVRIVCDMKFDSPNASLASVDKALKTKRLSAEVRSEMDLPVDLAALAMRARTQMKFEFEAAGKTRDDEGQEIEARVSVKRRAAVDATETPLD